MKAHLMFSTRDFDDTAADPDDRADLVGDLGLETLFEAMGSGDRYLTEIARRAVLSSVDDPDLETVLYRQAVLKDCLAHPEAVRALYQVAVDAIETKRNSWFGIVSRSPGGVLYSAVELLEMLVGVLTKLKGLGAEHGRKFESEGFRVLFADIERDLGGDYLSLVGRHLHALKFDGGVRLAGRLDAGNVGGAYVLQPPSPKDGWWRRLLGPRNRGYLVRLNPRDEAGARVLGNLRDRGVNAVADAAAQASDHVLGFFQSLRSELAFYLAATNLFGRLKTQHVAICFPKPERMGTRQLAFSDLRDVTLALRLPEGVVGNHCSADQKSCVVVTGANQGGKSTFLRSLGVAQVMLHAGLFVAAESFCGELCQSVLTHYKREEDAAMDSGKFDEELVRIDALVGRMNPNTLLLLNESFASTSEREGSEVARQIVTALVESGVKIFYVTHLAEFASRWWSDRREDTLFLRAQRGSEGRRTYVLEPGEPQATSYGADLYRRIFGAEETTIVEP